MDLDDREWKAFCDEFFAKKEELARTLFTCGALLTKDSEHPLVVERKGERGFLLKSHENDPEAPLSPYFLNLRTSDNPKPGPLTQEIVSLVGECMALIARMKKLTFEAVLGVPHAGTPFAVSFCTAWNTSSCVLLSAGKEILPNGHRRIGKVNRDGYEGSGLVLLIDDLITRADSKLEAIDRLHDEELRVHDVLVLVDREQGGHQELRAEKYELHWVYRVIDLFEFYAKEGYISSALRDEVRTYLKSPRKK